MTMSWDRIEGTWKQLKGSALQQWGRLTGAGLGRTAEKASREQFLDWLAREHKRDPIHK